MYIDIILIYITQNTKHFICLEMIASINAIDYIKKEYFTKKLTVIKKLGFGANTAYWLTSISFMIYVGLVLSIFE